MSETDFQILRTGGFVAALVLAVAAQHISPHDRVAGSWRINGAFWVLNIVVVGMVCGACGCAVASWAAAHDVGLLNSFRVPAWGVFVTTILSLDFVSYAWHRANHAIPLLWRFHQVHHSDPAFTVSTALRFHPGEILLSLPFRLAAVVALGASPEAVIAFEILFTVANLVEHGDIDLPQAADDALARICITPALHRLHHSRDWTRLNTNFGTVFVFWDRLLRTYHPSSSALRIETGLPDEEVAPSLRQALLLPVHRTSTPGAS